MTDLTRVTCPVCDRRDVSIVCAVIRPHRTDIGQDCYAGGKSVNDFRKTKVQFRRLARAVHLNRYDGSRTAIWAAYVGAVEVGRWADGSGSAWGREYPISTYRQWRRYVTAAEGGAS